MQRKLTPREGLNVSHKAWKNLKHGVYDTIKKHKGYSWIKSDAQLRSMRVIFNIPYHIPNSQIKDFIKEEMNREKKKRGDNNWLPI